MVEVRSQLLAGGLLVLALLLVGCAGATATPDLSALSLPTPVPVLAQVEAVTINLLESFPVQVQAVASGALPDGCTVLDAPAVERRENTFFITLTTHRDETLACTEALPPFEQSIALDVLGLPAGLYTVTANGVEARFELAVDNIAATAPAAATAIAPPTPACSDRLAFVGDVTVPDGARIAPGKTFIKTWRLRNDGTCTWGGGYALVFDSGDQMSGPDVAPLTREVPPHAFIDVSATLTAPWEKGVYQGFWKLRSASGRMFGIGQRPFWVKIVVPASATPPPPTVAAGGSSISGWVWNDLCAPAGEGAAAPPAPPPGCVVAADGSLRANGLYDEGEPRIGGMEVELGAGPCPSDGLAVVLADAAGAYIFPSLRAGVYCVSIDPLADFNLPLFIPGAWTFPPASDGAQTVTVDGNNPAQEVNFGWDYQF
ncbi:MAG: hypothetical protein K1X65_18105 [Caldilineales bacterium]|nr:hypothetical protein [Caldilineales bacterium]MCW5858017.1 hypothetical protein [Caldilineales bacterium]